MIRRRSSDTSHRAATEEEDHEEEEWSRAVLEEYAKLRGQIDVDGVDSQHANHSGDDSEGQGQGCGDYSSGFGTWPFMNSSRSKRMHPTSAFGIAQAVPLARQPCLMNDGDTGQPFMSSEQHQPDDWAPDSMSVGVSWPCRRKKTRAAPASRLNVWELQAQLQMPSNATQHAASSTCLPTVPCVPLAHSFPSASTGQCAIEDQNAHHQIWNDRGTDVMPGQEDKEDLMQLESALHALYSAVPAKSNHLTEPSAERDMRTLSISSPCALPPVPTPDVALADGSSSQSFAATSQQGAEAHGPSKMWPPGGADSVLDDPYACIELPGLISLDSPSTTDHADLFQTSDVGVSSMYSQQAVSSSCGSSSTLRSQESMGPPESIAKSPGPEGEGEDQVSSEPSSFKDAIDAAHNESGNTKEVITRKAWLPSEDSVILNSVAMMGFRWRSIAASLPGRSDDAVRNRWNRLHDHMRLAPKHDSGNMNIDTGGKPSYKCSKCGQPKRNHSCAFKAGSRELPPLPLPVNSNTEKRTSWADHEDETIRLHVVTLGPKWSLIAAKLPGRTEHAVRNRWHRIMQLDENKSLTAMGDALHTYSNDIAPPLEGTASPMVAEQVERFASLLHEELIG